MKNILKYIVLPIIIVGTIFSCGDRYEIDSQADNVVKTLTVVSDSIYHFEAINPREVVLSINSSGPWTASCSENWCTVSPGTSAESSLIAEISLSIDDNVDNFNERSALLSFTAENIDDSRIIEIVQYGMVNLVVDSISEVFAEEGETKSFSVLCNRDFNVSTTADWLSISPENSTASNQAQAISVSALSNAGQVERAATILVKTSDQQKEFIVKQQGLNFKITGEKEFSIPTAGSSIAIDFSTTANWKVIIPGECDWVTSSAQNGSGDGSVTLTVSENTTDIQRSTYVYFEPTLALLQDSILITQKSNAIPFTEEFFTGDNSVTFNSDGSATLYALPGSGSKALKSKIADFSYGKYTVNFSDIQIARTSSTMLMCITTPNKANEGIAWGAFAKPSYSDGWASEYWVSNSFGSKKRQRVDNDVLRGDIKKYIIDVKKSATPGMIDIDFYINDILLVSEQGTDGFASGDPMILTFWTYNYYDKENPAVFEPISLIYEPY